MANKILLVNPAKSPNKRRKTKRTAKQIAATKKLVAMNKRRAKLSTKPKSRSTKMAARKSRKRRTAAQRAATKKLVALNKHRRRSNPAKPKRRRTTKSVARRAGKQLRYRRRNPIRRKNILNALVMPAATAASGALALNLAWNYLPIPAQFKVGSMGFLARGLGAVGLSMLAGQVVKKSTAEAMGIGALTVVMHDAARHYMQQFAPGVNLSGMGYYTPALPAGNANMGLYVSDQRATQPPADMGLYVGEYDEMGNYSG